MNSSTTIKRVGKTLDFDFENISSGDEGPNFDKFLDILNRDAPAIMTKEGVNPPQLPRMSKEAQHLIEAEGCFDAAEYHNSNLDRNFGNSLLLQELNENLSDFSLAELPLNTEPL
jgi:hypothetical protein